MVAAHVPFLQVYILALLYVQPRIRAARNQLQPITDPSITVSHVSEFRYSLQGRTLANEDSEAPEELDFFHGVPECEPLKSILREAPPTIDLLGNFTVEPSFSLLLDCTTKRSRYILNSAQYSQGLYAPTPKLKIMQLESSATFAPPFQPSLPYPTGTVTVVDCQDTWLDMREFARRMPIQATAVAIRCRMILPEWGPFAMHTWTFNTSIHFPCNASSSIARAWGFPKQDPLVVEDADYNLGDKLLHARNQTAWCWSPQDEAEVFGGESAEIAIESSKQLVEESSGAVLVSCLCVAALIWIYCRDCCSPQRPESSLQGHARNDGISQWAKACSRLGLQKSSTADSRAVANLSAISAFGKRLRMNFRRASSRQLGSTSPSRLQDPCSHAAEGEHMHGNTHPRLSSFTLPQQPKTSDPETVSPDTAAWVAEVSEMGVYKPPSLMDDDSTSLSIKQSSDRRSLRHWGAHARTHVSACNTDASQMSRGGNTASISFGLRHDKPVIDPAMRTETESITVGLVREKSFGSATSRQERSGESSGFTWRSCGKVTGIQGNTQEKQSSEVELQGCIERALHPSHARMHGGHALPAHHPLDDATALSSCTADELSSDLDTSSNASSGSEDMSGEQPDSIPFADDEAEISHAVMHNAHASRWGRSDHRSGALGHSGKAPLTCEGDSSFGFPHELPLPPHYLLRASMKATNLSPQHSESAKCMHAAVPASPTPYLPALEGSVHALLASGASPTAAGGYFKNVQLESADSSLWLSNPTYTGDLGPETTMSETTMSETTMSETTMSDGEGVPEETTEETTAEREALYAVMLMKDRTGGCT